MGTAQPVGLPCDCTTAFQMATSLVLSHAAGDDSLSLTHHRHAPFVTSFVTQYSLSRHGSSGDEGHGTQIWHIASSSHVDISPLNNRTGQSLLVKELPPPPPALEGHEQNKGK